MVFISAMLGFGVPVTPAEAHVWLMTNILGDSLLAAALIYGLGIVIWGTVRQNRDRTATGR